MTVTATESDLDKFIARWTASSGNERANFQLFAVELCEILGVPRPDTAFQDKNLNDYTFERTVEFSHIGSDKSTGRIDLYKKNRSYSVSCWYGPNPTAPRIHSSGLALDPNASRALRQPR